MIIVEYIDEVWAAAGLAILPADPYERALHRFWAAYIDGKLFPSVLAIAKDEPKMIKVEAVEQLHTGIKLMEEAFERLSKGKGFFGGDAIGYLDIALGCFLGWFRVCEEVPGFKFLDDEKSPLLVGWADRCCSDEAVKDVMPENERLEEYAKLCRARLRATAAD